MTDPIKRILNTQCCPIKIKELESQPILYENLRIEVVVAREDKSW